jgi:hypothetical protein
MTPGELNSAQDRALRYVERAAVRRRDAAAADIRANLARAGVPEQGFFAAMQAILVRPRVDVHFHPERATRDGRTVADGLLAHGRLRTQFETGISSGSPTAYPGGERDAWERRLFDSAYQAVGVSDADRPKYGALEVLSHPDGASPRFGSCYFVLREEVARRCSFTFGGSQEDDSLERAGTLPEFGPVMAALVAELVRGNGAFGDSRLSLPGLVERLLSDTETRESQVESPLGRALDSFVEAQIHGPIDLQTDVRELVRPAGSSFRDLTVHGNESRGSWIEAGWILVLDLDECASRDGSGHASRRSREGGTRNTTSWFAHGSSSGLPTEVDRPGSRGSLDAATGPYASGEPAGRLARASSLLLTRPGAAGPLWFRCRLGARSSNWRASGRKTTAWSFATCGPTRRSRTLCTPAAASG